jgi:hypothetical protein
MIMGRAYVETSWISIAVAEDGVAITGHIYLRRLVIAGTKE